MGKDLLEDANPISVAQIPLLVFLTKVPLYDVWTGRVCDIFVVNVMSHKVVRARTVVSSLSRAFDQQRIVDVKLSTIKGLVLA